MDDPSQHPVAAALHAAWPPAAWADVPVLAAVSGGADSVALLRAMLATAAPGAQVEVVHVNHRLRGAAADADAAFVAQLAAKHGLRCHTVTLSWPAEMNPGQEEQIAVPGAPPTTAVEEQARAQRYAAWQRLAGTIGARWVALAHTADDQAETVLHRIVRGSGLAGLAGMQRVRELCPGVALVRPLLAVRRAQIEDYLRTLDQDYCHDASNDDRGFTRNRLRHELLPLLARDYNPRIAEALIRLGQLAGEAQAILEQAAHELAERACRAASGQSRCLDVQPLRAAPPHLARLALQELWREAGWPLGAMTFRHWQQLEELIAATGSPAPCDFPGAIRAERSADRLWLRPVEN